VPPGEQPFDTWVADKVITSRNQPPSQDELHMVDPAGTIFCTKKLDEEFVAIKTINCPADDGVPQTTLREISALKQLVHKHVMGLNEVCVFHGPRKRKSLALVCELMGCSLKKYMRARSLVDCLAPEEVRSFMKQLMVGMDFVHSRGIMHRDLKPQNLFICESNVLKIGGFDIARHVTLPMRQYTHEVITVWYRPLEILLGGKMYSLPVDMWSCGCCFAEMACCRPLFPGDCEISTIFQIFQQLGTPNYTTWPGLNELPDFRQTFPVWPPKPLSQIRNLSTQLGPGGLRLLDGLLRYDPARRIAARVALNQFEYLLESP